MQVLVPTPHIIFDFDGTLIDSSPAILETMGAVLHARGIPAVRPLGRDLIGPPLLSTLQALTGSADLPLLEALAGDFRARYDSKGLYATHMYPGIAEALGKLVAGGQCVYLATNKRLRPTQLLLGHFGLASCFAAVYCLDSRMPPYPGKGEMLLGLLDDRQLSAAQCVYVGDTRHDQQAAAYSGLRFVAVDWGYGVGEQSVAGGAVVLKSPLEFLGL